MYTKFSESRDVNTHGRDEGAESSPNCKCKHTRCYVWSCLKAIIFLSEFIMKPWYLMV